VFLGAILSFWMSWASLASASASNWAELVRACEAVIADQSFAPLINYEPAPFSMGLPGKKEYAVYDASRNLVAIATAIRGEWASCLVRESEEDRSRWRELGTEWEDDFEVSFPKSEYLWVRSPINPERPFRGAVRCKGNSLPIVILPNLETNFFFRVAVSKASTRAQNLCGNEGDFPAEVAPPARRVIPGPLWLKPDKSG